MHAERYPAKESSGLIPYIYSRTALRGLPCTARQWLEALARAVNRQVPEGARGTGLSLLSDHGCLPTSTAVLQAGGLLGSQAGFASSNNATGKADPERGRRTLKEECLGLQEWSGPVVLIKALNVCMADDNAPYWHSAWGDKPPRQVERDDDSSHSAPYVAA
jgi:hypothetical protein